MDPATATIGVLLVGIVVVVGGVLVLRLHAFLALILAAILVAALTPPQTLERYVLQREALGIVSRDAADNRIALRAGKHAVAPGTRLIVLRTETPAETPSPVGELEVLEVTIRAGAGGRPERHVIAVPREGMSLESITATDLIVLPATRRAAETLARETIGDRVAAGFGSTCAQIGILIAMASIIGKCLLDSGAADRIVRSGLRLLGERGAPLAFLWSGFLLGIPVFFDTVFYLMIPLGKAMRMRTGRNYLLYVLTIVAGATMAHSLVPPTPGPLLVAQQLGVELGVMILAGCIVGFFASLFGYVFASIVNRVMELPLRELPDFSLEELEAIAHRDERDLPPLALAVLPILLPVVLIGGFTILSSEGVAAELSPQTLRLAAELGDKNIALVLSALIAMGMLVWQRRTTRRELADAVQSALMSAGTIILITAAGGAFGGVLQQTGVANLIKNIPQASPAVICGLAFLITAAIRTAQGSATVAMITSVGVLSGLSASGALTFHPVYLALAIGCGSKPISWMNDSGFWVICKMTGMTEAETLKTVTPLTALMGVVGLGVTLVGVTFWPMLTF